MSGYTYKIGAKIGPLKKMRHSVEDLELREKNYLSKTPRLTSGKERKSRHHEEKNLGVHKERVCIHVDEIINTLIAKKKIVRNVIDYISGNENVTIIVV